MDGWTDRCYILLLEGTLITITSKSKYRLCFVVSSICDNYSNKHLVFLCSLNLKNVSCKNFYIISESASEGADHLVISAQQ
jgi:hypothetical protein